MNDTQQYIQNQKRGIAYNMKKLKIALEVNKKLAQREQRKNLFEPGKKLNIENFVLRQENLEKKRQDKIKELKRNFKEQESTMNNESKMDERSRQMTQKGPTFQQKINKMLKDKYENSSRIQKLKMLENSNLKESKSCVSILRNKSFTPDDHLKATLFYEKNQQWLRKKDTKNFYQKVQLQKQQYEKNKIPKHYFQPKLNNKKNKQLVQKSFEERNEEYARKKNKSLKKIQQQAYNYDFKPKLYKKHNRSFWQLINQS